MNIPEKALQAARSALSDEGLTDDGGNPHSWRCEHPDLYPGYCTCVEDLARAALSAAAPHLIAREVVTTVAEVDALPIGCVVLDDDRTVWTKAGDEELDWWERATDEMGYGNSDVELPAVVLYDPTKEAL